jgi:hypothetical protein
MNGIRLRHAGLVVLGTLLALLAAVTANVVGIHLTGGIDGWQAWLTAHRTHFLAWRLLLYTAACWYANRTPALGDACCGPKWPPSPRWWYWKSVRSCGRNNRRQR